MVKELGDKAAQGRTYGNLGNTYYLLGEFENAVAAHEKVRSYNPASRRQIFAQPVSALVFVVNPQVSVGIFPNAHAFAVRPFESLLMASSQSVRRHARHIFAASQAQAQ